jgi:hypothetical protein
MDYKGLILKWFQLNFWTDFVSLFNHFWESKSLFGQTVDLSFWDWFFAID